MRKNSGKKITPFDKYEHYLKAVQSPEVDCDFLFNTYKSLRGKPGRVLREDFCGTHAISCAWVERNRENYAIGVDLDKEPLSYGQWHYASQLNDEEQKRLAVYNQNVLRAVTPKADVIAALNFSFFIFKTRPILRHYFKKCYANLKRDGLLVVDCFGGPAAWEAGEDKFRIRKFDYFWEQAKFNAISNEALFYIHFKRDGERKREKVFRYDWRMWTIPEIREVMMEAGFRRTHVYWEGSNKRGFGNGVFRPREKGDECDAWIAYVVGEA